MKRKIEFYKINPYMKPIFGYLDPNIFIRTAIKAIKDGVQYDCSQGLEHSVNNEAENKSKTIIETLYIDDNGHFGIIVKSEDSQNSILRRLRKKEDNQIENNCFIEDYTYFYVNFHSLICAVLINHNAPKFIMHYTRYLKNITLGIGVESIAINNIIDEKIPDKLNKTKSIKDIDLIFDSNSSLGNDLVDIKKTFDLSQSTLINANVKINLKVSPITEKTRALFKDDNQLKTNFKKLILDVVDDNDDEDTIDLIEKILIKKVIIDIDDKYLRSSQDLEKIKDALINAHP